MVLILGWWWLSRDLNFFRLLTDVRWYFGICKCSITLWCAIFCMIRWIFVSLIFLIRAIYSYFLRLLLKTFNIVDSWVSIINPPFKTILANICLKLLCRVTDSDLFVLIWIWFLLNWGIWTFICWMHNNWRSWCTIIIWVTYFINSWSNCIDRSRFNFVRCCLNNLPHRIYLVTCCLCVVNLLWVPSFFNFRHTNLSS